MTRVIDYRVDGRAARLILDSPHNRNALSTALVTQLHRGLRDAVADPQVRLVVLGHTGGTFCAGADLSEAAGGSPESVAVERAREMTELLRAIVECPLPVVGAIDGHVRAGGMGLVGACDIVVAGPRSTFALTEARIGVAPSKLLIPLSYMTVLGGMITLIGTSTNILVDGVAVKEGLAHFSLFEIAPLGIAVTLAGGTFLALFGNRLLPDRQSMGVLLNDRRKMKFFTEVAVPEDSTLIGQPVLDIDIFKPEGVRVIDVLRGDGVQRSGVHVRACGEFTH